MLSGVSYTLGANVENLTLTGTAAINGTGNYAEEHAPRQWRRTIVLSGGTGADTMRGGAGNDTYVVDNAGDIVTELAGPRHRHRARRPSTRPWARTSRTWC